MSNPSRMKENAKRVWLLDKIGKDLGEIAQITGLSRTYACELLRIARANPEYRPRRKR